LPAGHRSHVEERQGVEASLGVRMLTSHDFTEALGLAVELDRLNQERRELEKSITEEAFARIATDYASGLSRGVTVFDPAWHVGVVGIVASRLVEKLHRPVFVLARAENGLIKGSGRSIAGVNLVAALKDCESLLQVYGGHEAAAGVTLSQENVLAFRIAFDEAVAKQTSPESFLKKTWVDGELAFSDISEKMLSEIGSLEPFGMGNAKPVFAARALEVASKRVVGEHHLKLKLASGGKTLDAIAFNKSADFDRLSGVTGLLFGVELNEYNGKSSVQLVVKDFFDAEH
jgi:single-stranded-DNA-specific exonuclease